MTKDHTKELNEKNSFIYNGKHYYIDGYLKSNLSILCERVNKDWDNLIIIDGDEGAGKSSISKTMGAFFSTKLNRPFSAENIIFNIDTLIEYASGGRNRIIIWDESALGGLAQEWNDSHQVKLKKLLITCRKYNHILIFIIPHFKYLSRYFATDRSICLIRVYSPDYITRGYFKFYNKSKKEIMHDCERKGFLVHNIEPDFWGRFVNSTGLFIDEEEYERKKDAAIESITQKAEDKENNLGVIGRKWLQRWAQLAKYVSNKQIMSYPEIAEINYIKPEEVELMIQQARRRGLVE